MLYEVITEAIYKYNLSERFYLTGMLMIGAGRADYEELGGNDYFFMMEPGASVGYRLTSSYNFV